MWLLFFCLFVVFLLNHISQEIVMHPSLVSRSRWNDQNFTFGRIAGPPQDRYQIHSKTLFLLGSLSKTSLTFLFFSFYLGCMGNLMVKKMLSILCWCIYSRRQEQCPNPNRNTNLKTRPLSWPCFPHPQNKKRKVEDVFHKLPSRNKVFECIWYLSFGSPAILPNVKFWSFHLLRGTNEGCITFSWQ